MGWPQGLQESGSASGDIEGIIIKVSLAKGFFSTVIIKGKHNCVKGLCQTVPTSAAQMVWVSFR